MLRRSAQLTLLAAFVLGTGAAVPASAVSAVSAISSPTQAAARTVAQPAVGIPKAQLDDEANDALARGELMDSFAGLYVSNGQIVVGLTQLDPAQEVLVAGGPPSAEFVFVQRATSWKELMTLQDTLYNHDFSGTDVVLSESSPDPTDQLLHIGLATMPADARQVIHSVIGSDKFTLAPVPITGSVST